MRGGRFLIAAVIVAAAAGALVWLLNAPRNVGGPVIPGPGGGEALGPPPETARSLGLRSSAECRACHEEVFAEWEGSHHAIAYTNPEVQKLSRNFRDRDCLPCHASRPVFETGLGNRVLEREVRIEEGVDCFTCHQFKNAMLGSPARLDGMSTAPCNPLPYAGITDLRLCSPCHDQHKVMQDWLLTEYASGPAKKDCLDCHMPPAERKAASGRPAYVGRSHRFPAAHDPATLRSAASMTTAIDERGRLVVTVKNDGTGHNVPADERHRALDLVVTLRDAEGVRATARVDRYRNPYRDEFHLKNPLRKPGGEHVYQVEFGGFGRSEVLARRVPAAFRPDRTVFYPESTQIPAGESRAYVITLPPRAIEATVRLIYKLNPFVEDDQGTLLHERRHEFAAGLGDAGAPEPRPMPSAGATDAAGSFDRADRILAEARAKGLAFVPDLLLLMKDRSHSAFVLVPDASDRFGLRPEENPYGGEDTRSLERIAAIVALAEIGSPQAIPELLLALDDRDGLPAVHAAEALVRFGNRAGIPFLLGALEKKVYENENAHRILRRISGEDLGFDSDSGMTARAAAVRRWRDWWTVFEKSGEKLRGEGEPYRKGGDPAADRRIARYVDVAGEFQFLYMEQARKMLRRLGPPAVPFLEDGIARAAGPGKATWRAEIAHILGGIAAPPSHVLLATLSADPHPAVRSRAIDALATSGAPDAADRARAALEDPDSSVVLAAIRSLAIAGSSDDAAVLAALGRQEPELVREIDLSRLRLAPSAQTFDAVARHLFDPALAARAAAMVALNALAGRTVLDDPSATEDARRAALEVWRSALPK